MQAEQFTLEKSIWTHQDFEIMGWHDASIHGISIEKHPESWSGNLLLDIDYIFKWVDPLPPNKNFTFWVAPCTLVFRECFDLKIDFNLADFSLDSIDITDLHLKNKIERASNSFEFEWMIELHLGQINLKSSGFEQIVKQYPIHSSTMALNIAERQGINFSRVPCVSK